MPVHPDSDPRPSSVDGDPMDASHIGARVHDRDHRRGGLDPLLQVRSSDLQPYTGLGYLSRLFRIIAVLLLVLLVAEVGIGLYSEGWAALRTLITEASRLIVVAGVLWGAGDLATLLIDVGHDVRATRILLGRQVAHEEGGAVAQPGVVSAPVIPERRAPVADREIGRPVPGDGRPLAG